ncbi:hypothetical protein, partial [Dysosmobacter sp.]|uniref:hypothetical protein n=1 Tax=Dysosmobacter sp. TaxID=2591382 RepID=UPI002A87EBB8
GVSQGEYEGESGEAPPVAEKANRFRGCGTISGPGGAGDRIAATVPGSPLVWNRMPAKSLRSKRLRRIAAAFWPARQAKKRGIVQAVKKSSGLF